MKAAALALALLLPTSLSAQAAFDRILWLDQDQLQDAALLQRVRGLGFTAVELGRGVDPAPLQQAGLACYVDQPAGKGLLELRDAEFQPLLQAFERDRDLSALRRPHCLGDAAAVLAAVGRLSERLASVPPAMVRFVALADEASATRHTCPLDLCRCEHCQRAFAACLQQRHGSIAALNRAWDSDHADFAAAAAAAGTDAIRRRELGGALLPANLRPWSERLEFVDGQLRAAVATLARASRELLPDAPVGLTGVQPPSAFGGHDLARLLDGLGAVEAYDVGGARALAASLLPGAYRLSTLAPPPADAPARLAEAQLCRAALHGERAVVVWNADAVFGQDGQPSPFGRAVQRGFERLGPALDACAGAELQPADVWLVESQASVRAWWMLDSAADGDTWPRRLSSYEAAHSTSLQSRAAWVHLLRDLGLQPRFVAAGELPERLLQQRPRLVVLPACIALSDRSCQALQSYVRAGGRLLADFAPALYDEQLVLRQGGALDPLFGIGARSLAADALLVREGRSRTRLPGGAGLAERGLELDAKAGLDRTAPVAEQAASQPIGIECGVGRGAACYLNLLVADYERVRLDPAQVSSALDLRQRLRALLQRAQLRPPFEVHGERLPTCIERAVLRTRDGRTIYACRLDLLDRPQLLPMLAQGGAVPVTLQLPAVRHLRVLGGDDLGSGTSFTARLDPYAGLFLVEVDR